MNKYFVVVVIQFFMLTGCLEGNSLKAEQLKSFVNTHLQVGDSEEKIIEFLESQGWPHSYDRFTSRYQARNPLEDDNKYARNQILIYVDESKSFVRVEVDTWYAAP